METLQDQVAVVTGAARGIGRAIALRLARAGTDVVIADLDLAGGAEFGEATAEGGVAAEVRALGRRAMSVEGDLGDRKVAEDAFGEIAAKMGRVDILVNCAGGALSPYESSLASASPDEDMAKVFAANFATAVHCCQAAVPHMRERGSGAIVNISSLAGTTPPRDGRLAYYGAAKAALTNYTRSLAGEVGPDGIRVNTVAAGIIMTARITALSGARGIGTPEQAATVPLRRLGVPDDIAKAVQFLVSDLSGWITGQCLVVNGGQTM